MLLAPAVGALGIVPFLLPLNISFVQFVLALLAGTLLTYVAVLLLGSPGYFLLRRTGADKPPYLIGYALALVAVAAILFGDVYALVSFGPTALLTAAAFCYFRGTADSKAEGQLQ